VAVRAEEEDDDGRRRRRRRERARRSKGEKTRKRKVTHPHFLWCNVWPRIIVEPQAFGPQCEVTTTAQLIDLSHCQGFWHRATVIPDSPEFKACDYTERENVSGWEVFCFWCWCWSWCWGIEQAVVGNGFPSRDCPTTAKFRRNGAHIPGHRPIVDCQPCGHVAVGVRG
jgi:hypothetical protein